ncbi:hypothetical protein [Salirhabdus sp. Marseille-P4669]|uniref:hypothetical protein n=1 Tax=Salirhabdus sp. Marseille-P4669 TaxID=2042310 RepID=UPI000C7B8A10|nr:hypothetical protein [Salirhabdus sp. Marseille-P4669]
MHIDKQKRKYAILLLGLLVIIGVGFYQWVVSQKPTMHDFVTFMEERYGIDCSNMECTSFEVEIERDGQKQRVLMYNHSGSHSTKSTSVKIEKHYFSEPGAMYFLHIKVKGSLGKYKVLEERDNIF